MMVNHRCWKTFSPTWAVCLVRMALISDVLRDVIRAMLREQIEGKTFYHGTYLDDALKIQSGGFLIARRRGRGSALGAGVYMSADRDWAMDYAKDIVNWEEKRGAIMELTLDPSIRFLDISGAPNWPEDLASRYLEDEGKIESPYNWLRVGRIARQLGYDAVGNPTGTLVVFDPSKVKVVSVDEVVVD